MFADPYFSRLLLGINGELAAADHQVALLMGTARNGQPPGGRQLCCDHTDGALIVSMHARHAAVLERVGFPVVSVGRPACADVTKYSYVDVDNRGGAARAVHHLIEAGRTRIATVAGPMDMAVGVDRLIGYRDALIASGRYDPALVMHGDFGPASGGTSTLRLLDSAPGVDAIFVASDLMAIGVLRALQRAGRRVPDDVAVIGFDNTPIPGMTGPPLTTIGQPVEALGAQAARELLRLIGSTTTHRRQTVLDTELVLRKSA